MTQMSDSPAFLFAPSYNGGTVGDRVWPALNVMQFTTPDTVAVAGMWNLLGLDAAVDDYHLIPYYTGSTPPTSPADRYTAGLPYWQQGGSTSGDLQMALVPPAPKYTPCAQPLLHSFPMNIGFDPGDITNTFELRVKQDKAGQPVQWFTGDLRDPSTVAGMTAEEIEEAKHGCHEITLYFEYDTLQSVYTHG